MSNIRSIARVASWRHNVILMTRDGERCSAVPMSEPFSPLCPITGLPARRRKQQVSSAFLIALWRASFGVSTARQLRVVKRFGLWEPPCGLAFFHPMIVGTSILSRFLWPPQRSRCLRNALAAPRPLRKDFYLKRGQCGFSEEEIPQSKERLATTVERPASGICDRPRKAPLRRAAPPRDERSVAPKAGSGVRRRVLSHRDMPWRRG